MAPDPPSRSLARRAAFAALATVALVAAHARVEAAWGVPIAAALMVSAFSGSSAKQGAVLGAAIGLGVGASFVPQTTDPRLVAIALVAFATFHAVVGAVSAAGFRRGGLVALLAPALLAGVLEALNARLPLGDYLGLAAATTGTPFLRVAPWLGADGVAATAVLAGNAVGLLLAGAPRVAPLSALALLTAALASIPAPESRALRAAAVVQPASAKSDAEQLDALLTLTRRAKAEGASLVVWPEAVIGHSRNDAALARIEAAARSLAVTIVAGTFDRDEQRNHARIFDVSGPIAHYAKRHLVPGRERYRPGHAPSRGYETAAGVVAPLICFDDCFRDASRAGNGGTTVIAVPTHDWAAVRHRHRRLSLLRAAEARLPLVRAADDGISQIVDARGRVIADADDDGNGVLLVADIAGRPGTRMPAALARFLD